MCCINCQSWLWSVDCHIDICFSTSSCCPVKRSATSPPRGPSDWADWTWWFGSIVPQTDAGHPLYVSHISVGLWPGVPRHYLFQQGHLPAWAVQQWLKECGVPGLNFLCHVKNLIQMIIELVPDFELVWTKMERLGKHSNVYLNRKRNILRQLFSLFLLSFLKFRLFTRCAEKGQKTNKKNQRWAIYVLNRVCNIILYLLK